MLSAGVESLEKRDFDAFTSAMSTVVQELYAGLPAALSAECPAQVLGANPEAFVLSCGGLPPEHQRRTHGLSVCPSSSHDRVDSPPQTSRPELMDLLAEETGGPTREDETRNQNATELDSFWAPLREGVGFPEEMADTVGDDSAPFPLCLEDDDYTGRSKEKNMLLTQQRGESSSLGLSSLETLPLLQNQEDRAKEEVTPENPPRAELQGMATDGTVPFSKTRERSPSTCTGVMLGHSELDVIVAKMAVPGTNTLLSLEPLTLMDENGMIGHSQREDKCRSSTSNGTLSAVHGIFPHSEARGENFLVYKDQDINMLVDHFLLAQHNEINSNDDNTSAPVLETRISLDTRPLDMNFEPSSYVCENDLTSGNLLWEESASTFEVVCETGEEGRFSGDEIELLEEWVIRPKMEESRSLTWSCEDLNEEQEMDHSYSCVHKEGVETHNGTCTSGKETQENYHWDEINGSLVSAANNMVLENHGSVFHDLAFLPIKENSQFSGNDRIEDINNHLSRPSSDEGLATLAGGNKVLAVEVKETGCLQNGSNVSIEPHSSSMYCDPELGNGGLSQTVSMCNQKTEILKTFRVVNLPAANSCPADIHSHPQEEHPERTQRTYEVLLTQPMMQQKAKMAFGLPLSLESLPGDGELLKSHAKLEMSGLLCNEGAFLSASQNGSGNKGGEMHQGTQAGEKREDDMEDAWSKARSCSNAGLSRLCLVLEACCAVSGGVSFVDVPVVKTGANIEESDDVETGDGFASTRNVISSHVCSGDSSDLDRAENALNPALFGEVPSTAPLNDQGLVDETENRHGIFGDNLIKSEGITDVNFRAFTCNIRLEGELGEDTVMVASSEMETVELYKDYQRYLLSGKQPCEGDLGKTLHPAELERLVKDQNGAEEKKCCIAPLCSSSSTDKSPTLPSLEINPAVEKMELPVSSRSDVRHTSGTRDPGEEETTFPFEAETEVRLLENISEGDFCRPKDLSERMTVKDTSENTSSTLQHEGLFPASSPEIFSRTSVCPSPCGGVLEVSQECLTREGRHPQDGEEGGGQTKPSVVLGLESPVNKTRSSEVGDCPEFTRKQTLAQIVSSCDIVSREHRRKKNVSAKGGLKWSRILEIEQPLGGISHGMTAKPGAPAQETPAAGSVVDNMDNRTLHRSLSETELPKRSEGLIRVESMEAKSPKCFSSNGNQLSGSLGSPLPIFCTLPEAAGLSQSRSRGACESPRTTRRHLIFRGQPRKAYSRVHTPKRPYLVTSPACFNSSPWGGHKLIRPAHLPSIKNTSIVLWDQSPKQTRTQTSLLLDVFKPSKYTKEPTSLLKKLSALADKLSALPRNSWKLKPVLNPPMAEKFSRLGSKTLPQLFSSVGGKLNSQWVNVNTGCRFKKFGSLSFLLYPLESASLCILEPSGGIPFAFAAPGFPASFHMKTELIPARNFSAAKSLQSVSHTSSWRETHARLPSEWIFSFLFSQNVTGITPVSKEAHALNSPLSSRNNGKCTITYSAPGLQTVLALFSPGCWHLWARKRCLPGEIAPARKVTFLRFTEALKNSNFSLSDLFSSLPSTLDGGLPTWRHLNSLSIPPSENSPLRSPCCTQRQKVTPATLPPPWLYLGVPNSSSAMFPPVPDQSLEIPIALKDDIRWEPSFSFSIPEPAWSRLGLLAPEFPVRALDELDIPVSTFPQSNARNEEVESEKKLKKVSQIRIRKTIPKPDPNLTPMGLPRPKRLKKTEFSLEEIYTNKNYKSPPATRSLETIFEEPKEKNGALISISHQKRKRILEFQDFTVPRKRRARSRVKVMGGFTRAQKAALEGRELDVLLIQRLMDLEAFFAEQEELWDSPGS